MVARKGFLMKRQPKKGRPGYVATSTAPGERYDGENGAVQPRIAPSNAPSTPQPFGRYS